MKIKPIYIVNFIFIAIIIALLFTPLRDVVLEKVQPNKAKSQFSEPKKITNEQFDIELQGVNTPNINFKTFKGKKIFLHYWGTWCPICVKEMPQVQKFYENSKNNIQFVFIYLKDDRQKVVEYMTENKYTFPVYEAVSPIDVSMLPQAFPTTFLIDEEGNIKEKIEGAKDWSNFSF